MTLKEQCAFHWQELGVSDPKILREHITGIFNRHDHQQEILIDLYKLAFPQWDEITKITGYPEVGREVWMFICRPFQEFDRQHHSGCLPGGALPERIVNGPPHVAAMSDFIPGHCFYVNSAV